MKILPLLALAVAGVAAAQTPTPTPPMCPSTAGLEIGMTRPAAFDMMKRKAPELRPSNVRTYHHAPEGRRYQVDVTFASEAPDARVVKLFYVFQPVGVFDALRDRWGEPADRPAPGSWRWHVKRCDVTLLYHARENEHHQVVAEELTVTPLEIAKK